MASAWGKSWGNSWGNSWGTVTAPTPTPAALVVGQGMLYGAPVHPPKPAKPKKPKPTPVLEEQPRPWLLRHYASWLGPVRTVVTMKPMTLTVRRNLDLRAGKHELVLGPVASTVSGLPWPIDQAAQDDE